MIINLNTLTIREKQATLGFSRDKAFRRAVVNRFVSRFYISYEHYKNLYWKGGR